MRDTLKKAGVPVWYLVAKDEGHGFAKKGNRTGVSRQYGLLF
jgi:dipeptidyl aminopeptidase/acylaminoacyl peptidase